MDVGQKMQREKESAQVSLFGAAEIVRGNGAGGSQLPDVPEWTSRELLGYEKEALGFYITGHPLDRYGDEIRKFTSITTATLSERPDKSEVKLCGIVASLSEKMTKRGDRMAFFSLEDRTGSVEVMVFPDTFAAAAPGRHTHTGNTEHATQTPPAPPPRNTHTAPPGAVNVGNG